MTYKDILKDKVNVTLMSQRYILDKNKHRAYIGLVKTEINNNEHNDAYFVFMSKYKINDKILNNIFLYTVTREDGRSYIYTKKIYLDKEVTNKYCNVIFASLENKYGISVNRNIMLVNVEDKNVLTVFSLINGKILSLYKTLLRIKQAT